MGVKAIYPFQFLQPYKYRNVNRIMSYRYRKKVFVLLCALLFLFGFIFIFSLLNPSFNFINVGLPSHLQNQITAVFSFCSILLILWDLQKL